MRNVILFDDDSWEQLLPLTYVRPVSEIRCGILTIREKWAKCLDAKTSYITQEHLSDHYPIMIEDDNLVIAGNVLPNPRLLKLINELNFNEALMVDDDLVAARLSRQQFDHLIHNEQVDELMGFPLEETPVERILKPWHIFQLAENEIRADYRLLCKGRASQPKDNTSTWDGSEIFIEEGTSVKHSIIDATDGPVFIGTGVTVLPGSMIKGPIAICDHSVIKMGAKIYGSTVIGPFSKVGGEVSNSVIFGWSNKGHDGYLGNSIIGHWCNLGADTNVSNLRNDYGEVSIWSHATQSFEKTGLQFCGLIMGDHSKCSINTMFNTGTVVGVSSNIFGSGFHPRFIPSFSWGGSDQWETFRLEKSLKIAERVMARRNETLTESKKNILSNIHQMTGDQRS